MFLQLNHQQLEVYKTARLVVKDIYKITDTFPSSEKYALGQQLRRAALSVHLNIAEGSSRKSIMERRRFYEIARGSLVELDAAFDIASDLNYCSKDHLDTLGSLINKCFILLTGMINK